MVEWPLWFGLVLPLGLIIVANLVIVTFLLSIINVTHSKLSMCRIVHQDNNMKKLRTVIVIAIHLSLFSHLEWIFGLLSINSYLYKQSESFQVIFSILVLAHGVLTFVYILCSNDDAKVFWMTLCKTNFSRNMDDDNCTTENSVEHSSLSFTRFKIAESESDTENIATESNQAYKTVRIQKKKEMCITPMTKNEAYQICKPKVIKQCSLCIL